MATVSGFYVDDLSTSAVFTTVCGCCDRRQRSRCQQKGPYTCFSTVCCNRELHGDGDSSSG